MADYDWVTFAEADTSEAIFHPAASGATTTVCGERIPLPAEAWRFRTALGNRRPCDNCDRILALRADDPLRADEPPTSA